MPLDTNEAFQQLTNPPIVEALIDIRARAETEWSEQRVVPLVKEQLSDYKVIESFQNMTMGFQFGNPDQPAPASTDVASSTANVTYHGWIGLRLASEDAKTFITIDQTGLAVSRLAPYSGWLHLESETNRVLDCFASIAKPTEAQRIATRCLNRFLVPMFNLELQEYLTGLGDAPDDFKVARFFHQDVFTQSELRMAATRTRTIQVDGISNPNEHIAILLDIDAFLTELVPYDIRTVKESLAKLHWLRNKMFFESITHKARGLFQ